MKLAVIIPAAGSGTRFGAAAGVEKNKVELDLAGKPIFLRSIELFLHRPEVVQIILAVAPGYLSTFKMRWGDKLSFHGVQVVPGGTVERWETVLKALEHVSADVTHVGVHDAARPLASPAMIDRAIEAAGRFSAVIPGLPVNATLKKVTSVEAAPARPADPLDAILGDAGKPAPAQVRLVVQTVPRNDLVEVQTPQIFEAGLFRRAYQQVAAAKVQTAGITDDAGLIESMGEPVYVVEGEATNIKITRPADLELAQLIVAHREQRQAAELGRKRLFKDDED